MRFHVHFVLLSLPFLLAPNASLLFTAVSSSFLEFCRYISPICQFIFLRNPLLQLSLVLLQFISNTFYLHLLLFGWCAPYIVNIFLVFRSKACNSAFVHPMILAPYLMIDTALELTADMMFPKFSFDFNMALSLPTYSLVT